MRVYPFLIIIFFLIVLRSGEQEMIILPKHEYVSVITQAVDTYSKDFGVEKNLVIAIITKESNGNPDLIIHEPSFFKIFNENIKERVKLKYTNNKVITTRVWLRCSSYGLMQTMGQTAIEFGFSEKEIMKLLDINYNINIGTKILARRIDKYGLVEGIASYNSGSPKYIFKRNGWKVKLVLKNQNYVDEVIAIKDLLDKEVITAEECLKSYYEYSKLLERATG